MGQQNSTCSTLIKDEKYTYDLFTKILSDEVTGNDLRLVVDEKHKILYCELPKVGCTNWKRTMLQLIHPDTYGKMDVEDIRSPHGKKGEHGYRYLSEWPPNEQVEMIKTYYKFMFARHPFERLLSAYRDKVQKVYLGNHFLKRHMDKLNDEKFNIEMDIEGFHSFVKYLISRGHDGRWGARQRHWRRYTDVCKVCSIEWNFIGKMETINMDADYVLMDMGVDGLANYPKRNKTTRHDTMIKYYADMGPETIRQLYELYKADFEIFGYEIPLPLLHPHSIWNT